MTHNTIRRTSESRLAGFAVGLIVIVFGFWTGFDLNGSIDIPLHGTYFVLRSWLLLIMLVSLIGGSYLLTLGLKQLSQISRVWKMIAVVLSGIVVVFFLLLFFGVLLTIPNQSSLQLVNSALAIPILFFGLTAISFIQAVKRYLELKK